MVQAGSEGLTCGGRALDLDPRRHADSSGSTTVRLEGASRLVCRAVDLPFTVTIELTGRPGTAPVLGLRVESPGETRLPSSVWYRLEGPSRGELRIDLDPGLETDTWNVQYGGGGLGGLRLLEDRVLAQEWGELSRLAVVLDRTCPELEHWSAARFLSHGGVAALGMTDVFAGKGARSEGAAQPASFNAELRDALGAALEAEVGARGIPVEGWWVADTAGDGIAEPEEIALAAATHGGCGTRSGTGLRGLFANAGYAPGLDLWDPLELAMEDAVGHLTRDGNSGLGLLVVGNSPPTLPEGSPGPFDAVTKALGPATAVRRRSSGWARVLAQCAREGIRVLYLFLEHDQCARGEERDLELARQVQQSVLEALRQFLPVVTARADREGVTQGTSEALRQLQAPQRCPSGVRVTR